MFEPTKEPQKMSEITQSFEKFIQNLNDELGAISQKYPKNEEANDDSRWHSPDDVRTESTLNRLLCTDGNAKIQNNLNAVRNCLGNRIQVEQQAIESLSEGKEFKNFSNTTT